MVVGCLRPEVSQRGWGRGPYCWVEVQGPSGPRDPYAVHINRQNLKKIQ